MAQKITKRADDYGRWYTDLVQHAKLADYGPVRGCMVIRPNGFAIWEKIQAELDRRFKETGHENLYFPLFIPESFLKKEAEHVEGFAPELAVVTHGGGKELEEPLVVRPTSETMVWHMYKNWINSWRDLPLLYNQWANVVRWEMRTRLFLRTTEFLWQEGHTAHATEGEAREEAERMLEVYRSFIEDVLAIPLVLGRKTAHEKFAGAVDTFTMEGCMQDGKALQMGTSHYLGQNFAKAFDVTFQNKEGELEHVYATSWGVTSRLIGAMIMTHSDDQGLVLPPAIASKKVVIVPIWRSDEDKQVVRAFVEEILKELQGINVYFDDREEYKPGFKFNHWELQGIPLRIEVGPRDVSNGECVVVRRDVKEKQAISIGTLRESIDEMLEAMQKELFEKAVARREEMTSTIDSWDDFEKAEGFVYAHHYGQTECEVKINEESQKTIRCIPFDAKEEKGSCIKCNNPSERRLLFAKAY